MVSIPRYFQQAIAAGGKKQPQQEILFYSTSLLLTLPILQQNTRYSLLSKLKVLGKFPINFQALSVWKIVKKKLPCPRFTHNK
jgi:hypothetical protein